jgi:hypothetical protein
MSVHATQIPQHVERAPSVFMPHKQHENVGNKMVPKKCTHLKTLEKRRNVEIKNCHQVYMYTIINEPQYVRR